MLALELESNSREERNTISGSCSMSHNQNYLKTRSWNIDYDVYSDFTPTRMTKYAENQKLCQDNRKNAETETTLALTVANAVQITGVIVRKLCWTYSMTM